MNLSVIIPVYRPNFVHLSKAIESLNAQSFKNFDVIWIFSGVLDTTVVEQINNSAVFVSTFVVAPGNGLSAALNSGLDIVSSDYVARFDADDICHPQRFEIQLNFLISNPDIDICGSDIVIVNAEDEVVAKRYYPSSDKIIRRAFLLYSPLAHPALMFRKRIFDGYRYNESFSFAEDLELFLRLRNRRIVFHNLPYPLLQYRELRVVRSRNHLYSNFRARLKNVKYFRDLFSVGFSFALLMMPSRLVAFSKSIIYSK